MRFKFSEDFTIDTSEEPWKSEGLRVGLFANPGAGKSYNAALLVEQWLDQGGTIIIFEPRAEWHTLKQKYPVQVVGGPFNQDVPLVASEPRLYAEAVIEQGVSMVFYTGDIEDEEELVKFVTSFINRLLRLQEKIHRPILLVLEETQEYAPRTPSGHIAPPWVYNRMIKALKDCFTQGRKLNVCPVALSQRPQEVNFTIRQLCNFTWFGGFSAQDVGYLDKEVFVHFRKNGVDVSARDLLGVPSGEWLVITGRQTHRVKVTEKRKTPHGADTPTLEYVQPVSEDIKRVVSDLGEQLKKMLEKRAAEESEIEKLKRKNRQLEKHVEDLENKLRTGMNIRDLLKAQPPNGITEKELKKRVNQVTKQFETQIIKLEKRLQEKDGELENLQQSTQNLKKELDKRYVEIDSLKKERGDFVELRRVFRKILGPAETRVVEKQVAPAGPSKEEVTALIDKRIQQLTAEAPPTRIVTVNLSERFREIIQEDFIADIGGKVRELPQEAKKIAIIVREKTPIKTSELYFMVRGKTGRIPANFYQQIRRLEDANLTTYKRDTGFVSWSLGDFIDGKLIDLYDVETRGQVKEYLASLLLPTKE